MYTIRCRRYRRDCSVHQHNETPDMLCTGHTKWLFGTVSKQNPNHVALNKLLIACIGPKGQMISWRHHVMPMQSNMIVIVQLCRTFKVVRTYGKMGRGVKAPYRETGNINVWSRPLPWRHLYWDVWFKVSYWFSTNYFLEWAFLSEKLGFLTYCLWEV